MPNDKEILNDMEFESHLAEMGDNQLELIKFVARQQYKMSKLCPIHNKRIKALENKDKKMFGLTGGVGGIIGAIVASIIDYFARKS